MVHVCCSLQVLRQLQAAGVQETIEISRLGYPVKMTYSDFIDRYRVLLPHKMRTALSTHAIALASQDVVVSTKITSPKPLRDASSNQIRTARRSKRQSSNLTSKPQFVANAVMRKTAAMIVYVVFGSLGTTASSIHTVNKENSLENHFCLNLQSTEEYYFGHHRVLLKENQVNEVNELPTLFGLS